MCSDTLPNDSAQRINLSNANFKKEGDKLFIVLDDKVYFFKKEDLEEMISILK